MTSFEAGIIANKSNAKKLLLTHFWPEEDKMLYLKEAKQNFKNVEVCKCQYKNVQKRENNYVQKEEYYMFSFSSSKCSNLSLILYDNPFILTIVE